MGSLISLLLGWLPLGGLLGWIAGFILYFASIRALFDLEEADTWWCVVTIFLVRVLVVVVVIGMLI